MQMPVHFHWCVGRGEGWRAAERQDLGCNVVLRATRDENDIVVRVRSDLIGLRSVGTREMLHVRIGESGNLRASYGHRYVRREAVAQKVGQRFNKVATLAGAAGCDHCEECDYHQQPMLTNEVHCSIPVYCVPNALNLCYQAQKLFSSFSHPGKQIVTD
ncbi:MAG: hypothetical protein WA409_17915, partial [Candidatus Binatus sp.]